MVIYYPCFKGHKKFSWTSGLSLRLFKLSDTQLKKLNEYAISNLDDLCDPLSVLNVCFALNSKAASHVFSLQHEIEQRSIISEDTFRKLKAKLNHKRYRYSNEEIAVVIFLQSVAPLMKKNESCKMLFSVQRNLVKTKKQQVLLAA